MYLGLGADQNSNYLFYEQDFQLAREKLKNAVRTDVQEAENSRVNGFIFRLFNLTVDFNLLVQVNPHLIWTSLTVTHC